MSKREDFNSGCYSGEEINDRMNGWKEELTSPADTYIEWRFEHKCRQLSDGFRIITEWRKRKLQYIAVMKTITMDFQHYSRHDVTHSICILETIEQLLGKQRVDMLSAGDLWLLLEAAYSHDIGMAVTYDQMLELWDKDEEFQQFIKRCIEEDMDDVSKAAIYYKEMDNLLHRREKMENLEGKEEFYFFRSWPVISQYYIHILVAEYIRKHHAERVTYLFREMDKETETIIPLRLYQVVILVSQMHGKDFDDILSELKYCTNGFGSGTLHPQFAAAMLRIGDLLDIDNNRFDPYAIKHFGRLPLASLLHRKKHTSITHICVSESEIAAEADAEEYEVALLTDEWFQMIEAEVVNLICSWNEIVPEALRGCVLKKSNCKVYLKHQRFDSTSKKEFSINKKKIINLLIGANIYSDSMEFLREYLQNAMDASKMQLWMDLKSGRYDLQRNRKIFDYSKLGPFDLDRSVYNNYPIRILFEWNEKKDKIRLKIVDQGIGIEREYFKKLSDIGTGWRGREKYKDELFQMAKWLQPTGGFGIGIQSAFMVTDSVEIITKSDKDAQGYKVRLMSPNRSGNISVENYDIHQHGTTIIFEIESERFQGWMERQQNQDERNIRFLGDKSDYKYDLESWDEFDSDGILFYVKNFFINFIKAIIPNPLFPIEIGSPVTGHKLYQNPYWPKFNYWEYKERGLVEEWEYGGKQYLGIFAQKDSMDQNQYMGLSKQFDSQEYFWVWNKTDCILIRICNRKGNHLVCFKNVIVREIDDTLLDLFCKYFVCIDLMGFHVDNCLKLHRNSFHENFRWDQYCYDGFRMYIQFLHDQYWKRKQEIEEDTEKHIEEEEQKLNEQLTPDKSAEEKQKLKNNTEIKKYSIRESGAYNIRQDKFITAWQSYQVQMMRLIAFRSMYDEPYCVGEDNCNKIIVRKYVPDNENVSGIRLKAEDVLVDESKILNLICRYYDKKETPDMGVSSDAEEPIILIYNGENYQREGDIGVKIHRSKIKNWLDTGKSSEEDSEKLDLIFNTLVRGIGIIRDKDTVKMLFSDCRIYAKKCEISAISEEFFLVLYEEKEEAVDDKSFFDNFWEATGKGRRFVTNKKAETYPQLRIRELPFRVKENRSQEVYLLSPVSNNNVMNIKKLKNQGRRFSYEEFRECVWGKRNSESPEYNMLIDWVYKHQIEENQYTKEEIKEGYENFLHNLFKECVYET